MNYNVKRFTRPIKGVCSCNNAAVKSIANLANNNIEYRQYNKAFFMRQLGGVMERVEHNEDHVIIEPVIPGQELAMPYIDGARGSAGQMIAFDITDEQLDQGMLIITTKSASDAVENVMLVYPREYTNNSNNMRSLLENAYSDIFITIPLSKAALNKIYERAIEKYESGEWMGSMNFKDGLSVPNYDYKLYVYLFPE